MNIMLLNNNAQQQRAKPEHNIAIERRIDKRVLGILERVFVLRKNCKRVIECFLLLVMMQNALYHYYTTA